MGWGEMVRGRVEEKVGLRPWPLNKSQRVAVKVENWAHGGEAVGEATQLVRGRAGCGPRAVWLCRLPITPGYHSTSAKPIISNCVD